jgi:hypothetical protein
VSCFFWQNETSLKYIKVGHPMDSTSAAIAVHTGVPLANLALACYTAAMQSLKHGSDD